MAVKHKDAYAYHLYIDGKQTDVNVDYFNEDGGAEAYAKAYPGASIRMRDEQGKDYNVPLEKMGFARTKGLHPFKMQYVKEYTEDDVSDWLMPGQEDKTEAANAIRQNGTIIDSIAPNEVKENKEVKAVPVVAPVAPNKEVKEVKEVKDTMPVTSAAVMPVTDTTARRGDGSMLTRPADTSQVVNDSIVNPTFRPDSIAPNAVGKVEVDSAYNAPKGDSKASYYDSLVQYYIDEEGYDLTGAKEKALGKILQEDRAADSKRLQENKEVRASESTPANAPIIPAVANAWRGSKNVTEAQSNKAYAWDSNKGEWSNPKLLEDYQRNAARMYGHAQPEEMRGMPITERDAEYVWAYSPEEYREMLADAREEMKRGQRPSVITDLEEDYAKAVAYSKGESAEKPLHWDYWRKREGLEAPVIDYRSRLDGGVTPTKKQEPTYNANDGSILSMNIEKEDSDEQSQPSYVGGEVTSQLLGDIAQQSAEVQRAKDVKANADYEAQAATPFIEEDAKKVYQEVKAQQGEQAWNNANGIGGKAFVSPIARATVEAREMAKATSLEDAIEKSVTKVVDNAIAKGGVADIISAYVNNGFSAEQAQNMAIENIATRTQQTIFDEYKAQRAPKGTLDYIMSAAMHNSIVGSLAQGLAGIDDTATQLNEEAIAEAGEKEGMLARVAGGVGSLVLDAPAFAMGGGIGGAVSKGATNLLSKGAAKMALKASGELGVEAGSRYLASSLTGRVAQASIASGTTLGAYDAMAEGARQFRVKDLDLGAIVNRASHGFALGAMLGPIGQGSKYLSRNMSARGKMMVDAGAFVTEAEVFNLGGSLLSGEKIDASTHGEGFVESALTLLAMKGTHLIANPGGLKASIKARYNSPDYPNKARMTAEDLALMKSLGYDINTIFKVTKRGEGVKAEDGAIDVNAEFANAEEVRNNAVKSDKEFLENYANMMKDANVPMEIKAKLALRVEGKIVESLPKATGMREIKTADGRFAVETLSSNGEVITRKEFSKKADADKLAQEMMNVCEANSYELMERAVDATQSEIGLQDVFNKIAAERGADAREIANEIYEISRKKESERTPEDQALMNAFEATVVEVRDTMRTSEDIKSLVERTTGLNVEDILKKSADKRTLEEVEALAIYRRELLKSVGAKTYEAAEGAETVTPDVKEVKDAAPVVTDKEVREVNEMPAAPKAEAASNRVSIEDVIELFGRDDASAEMMRKDADSYADTIEDLEADRQEAVAYSRGDGEKPIYWDYWKERDGLAEPVVKTDKEINEMSAAPEAPKAEETALVADREVNKAEKTAVKPESNRYGVEYSQIETRTNAWNERTGVTTKVVTDVDAITNNEARAAITEGRRITGWYEVATGDVVIYAPNVVNMDEVDKTYVHEVVSHKGINGLLGEKYAGEFYDKVYNDVMNDAERERFNNYAGVGGIKDEKKRHRVAAEEYVANLAEKPEYDMTAEERITWQQIVEYIRTIINKILGNGKLTHQDIKDTLRFAYQKLRYEAEAKRGAAPVVTDKEVREVNEVKKPAPVVEAKANATTLFNSPKKRKRNYKTKVIMPRSGKDITRHAHSSVEFAKALEAEYADAPSEVRDLISHIAPLDEYIDAEDAVYGALGSKNKLILQSDGVRIGVAEELGLPPKELQKALGINAFASRANGGVSLQELAERVAESAFDSYDKERIEAPEVRNMLIEAIYSVTEPADLAYYRANRRIQEAQKIYDEYMEQERAWRDEWESREDAYEAMVISDLEAKEKASKDLPENYFDNKFADELNENSYGQSRNNTTIGRGNKILHEEQIGDRRGIGENQGRAGLQQEVGNRMRSENEVSQEGIVSKASEWSLGSKERNNSITNAEGKSVSIKGYPEELFESEQALSDVEIKDRKRIYRDYKNVLSMDELRELNQLNSEIDNRDEALKKAVDAFLANKVSRQEMEAMAKQYDAIINRRSELFQKAHELKAETKRGAAPVTPNKEVKETAIAGGRISREDAEAAIARGEEKRLKAEGIRFADRTDYSDMLVKAAEKKAGKGLKGQKGEGLVVGDNSLVGIHNISAEKLLKAINMGGLANPSAAVVDVNTGRHEGYGAISLILPSSKVSKKTGKNVGTWMGDAYTPTYPHIEKYMTDAGEAKKVADLRNLPDDIRPLVRKSIDAWIDGSASYQDGLMYMFLVENDMTPKTIYKGGKYSAELVDKVGELLGGEYSLRNADSEVLPKVLDEYIASQYNGDRAAYEEAFARRTAHLEKGLQSDRPFMRHRSQEALSLNEKYGFDYNSVQSWLNELGYELRTRGEVDDYRMIEDMRKTVDENGMRNEYIEWLDNLEKRYDIQERIFKGFNARGDRKYIPHTLENVSKEMKKEGKNGTQSGGSFANFTALMLPKKQELAGIREYKHNLHGEHEATEAFRDKWTPIYLELGEKLQKGDSGFVTYGFERLAEAAQEITKGRDANSYLKKEYGVQLSEKDINQLKEMINAIQTEYPTMYFETKFERPVRLNEFASAVVPEGTSQKIINALEEAGLKIETYDSNVEGSRQEAVRRASEGEGIRFRFVGEKGAEALDKAYERTTLRDNLNVAREMELSGKDARTIKLATGWERGADGKWRLEQADELDLKNGVKSNKLKDYITAPELFKAYPALQNVEVKFEDLGGNTFGLWNSRDTFLSAPTQQEGVILIHDKLSEDAIKKVLAHEIQHAIQYYEGFESGANVDTVNPKKAEQISKNKQIAKERIAEYTKERDKINNELSSLNDKMEDWYNRNGDAEFDAEMTAYQKRYNELQEQYDAVAENIRFNRNWLDAFDRADLSLGREGYRRVMGEVESRNVESRLGMTAEERKNSLAIDTEDVAREDQILIAGKDSGYSGDYGVRFSVREEEAELDRINARFNEELQQQINGTLPKGYIYQLGMPSMVLRSTGIPMLPIQLNSMRLEEKSKNFGHDFELSEVKDLVKAISAPVAVFAYGNKGKAQNIVVEIQHEGKNFIVGLSISPSVGGRVLNINSIRNVFPKDNAEWLNWINQGKALYLNKEKIQNLIDQQRTNLADVDYLDLDSITKVIESFENPTIQDGILFREKELDEEYERVAPEADIASERYSRGEITAQEYFDVVNDFNDVLSRRSALYEKAHRLKDKANGGSIRYSSRESNDRNLVGLHNLTESNLAHAEKMGGIANPSMAVVNRDIATLNNFGEITLIAPKSLIDKRAGKNAGTWGADAYSPRYPRVEYRFSDKAYDELFSRGRAAGMADYEISRLKQKIEDNGKRWLVGDRDVLELFAYEGKPGERIDEYVDNLVDGLTLDERIFRGYTPMGNRRYVSHTLENVSRIMKSEGRAGAEGSFGMGSVRATLTPIFKTIAQIGKNRDRIVSHEEFEKAKESLEERFYELSRLTNTGKYDYASGDRLGEAMLHSNPKLYLSKEYGIEISDAESDAIRTLAADLRVMPAEYFETKFERPVELYEFVGAVIPKDATAKTRRILKEAGIDYLEYDRGIPGDRLRAVRRASEGEGIRFREGGMPWNEGESLMDALDRNYKRKSKLEIAVANMERKRDAGRSIDEDEYNAMKAELTKIREDIRFMQNGPTQPTLQHGETIYDESFANRMEAWREDLAAWKDKKYDADVMLDQLLQSTTGERATMTDEELREILEAESDKIDATIKETKTLIKDQIISRVSNIGVRYWDDVVKVKDIKSKTTAEERKLMPHLLEGSYDIIPNKGEMYHEYVEERKANNPDLIELGEYDDVSTDVAVYDAPATGNKHGIKHSDVIDYAVEGDNVTRKVLVGKGNHGMIEFEDGTFFPLYPFDMEYLAWRESKGARVPKEMMSDVEESLLNQFLHNEIETYLPNGIRDFMDVKYIDAHTLDVMNEVREWYDDLWYEMEALGMNFGKEKRYFYVTHIWDKKKSTPTSITTAQKLALATKPKDIVDVESYVATNTPYMRTRMFDSLLDGMALGLVPKYEDIADIILDYGHRAAEAIENRKMVKFLKMLTVNGIPALREVGGRNEGIYTVINNNALRGYEVLKDVKPLLNVIFGPTHSSESAGWQAVGKGYDIVGGLAKKIELSLSFFHHGALTETAIAMNGPFRTMKIVGKHLMWDCIKNGDIPAFNDPELTRDAVKHLVVLGATQDYATKDVQMATEKLVEWTRKIHGVHEAAKLVDFVNKGSDKILWDYLHDGLKVYAYEKMAKEIRARAEREGIDNETLEKMLNEAGQLVNDTFGGQHFELLGWSPSTVKWARRFLLSPDWTMSTIRQALAPMGVGQLYNDEAFWKKYFKGDDVASVRKQYGRAFWLRAALFAIPLVTGINMCNRMEDEEEQKAIADEKRKTDPNYLSPYEMAYPDGMKWYDYTMYGNTVGHSTHLFMGRYEDGSEQYLRWGKQFRELPELMFGPDGFGFPDPLIHKIVGKLNPMADAFINLISGNSFTGWVNEDMKDKEGLDKNLGRLTYLGKKFIPFAWNLDATTEFKPIDLLMPSTKGFSRGKAIKQFKVAIMNDDKDYAKLVMDACKMNGLNGDQLLETAWKVLEAEGRKNMVEGVETVDDAISQYDAEANPERREQLKYFIMRQMSLRDIRMISNEQAVEQAWNTLMTAGDNSKADKVYNTINSSEDVLQDWRMSRVMAELKPFKAEYNKQETYDEAEAYYNEHKAEIDKYEDLLEARRYINEYKRAMGNDADNAELLRLIRDERKKALGIKEN